MTDAIGSVTGLIPAVREGNADAQATLWNRFRVRLREVARQYLRTESRQLVDEEDAGTDAVCSVLRRLRNGQYPELSNRNDLWRLLIAVTIRKAVSFNRYAGRQKRNDGHVTVCRNDFLDTLPNRGLDDRDVTDADDFLDHLLSLLPNDELRQSCILRLEGLPVAEIANQTGRSIPTIERRLRLIRDVWAAALEVRI